MKPLFAFVLFCLSLSAFAQVQPALPPLVSVTGLGEVKVAPDQIALNVGIDVRDKNLENARRQNDQKIAALLNYLKRAGIDAKDIQTTNLSVYPNYVGEYGQTTPEFYMTQKSITVTIRDIKKFDEILTGIYKTGANRVEGIEYRTSELQKHREQARKLAVQAARQKAMALTSELGSKVGRVYAINESGSEGYPTPLYRGRGANKMMESVAVDAGGPTIAVGQITVSASVDVSFVIE
ncbi:SIMPL domain-containing protein [Adhaeribacter aquaticus]|uniref:SIMPL domain-containing protein n=1 Tax=Adhaeribacter aquaticus TaxID=299567 RepID=UPI0004038BC2|nr:SIMPL domain-containing protein [Adhaeribacter aquaticus]